MARMMKDSGIPWIGKIPSDWSIGRMKYNYYMKGRIGWQGLKAEEFIDDGPFLITGTDFINGRVNWDTCYHISQERYDEAPEIHVKDGDLLITKDGTVGKVAFIENKPDQVSLNSHLLLIRPKRWAYENRFLFWVLQSGVFTKFNLMSQNGTVMASLSQEKISAFSFPLPDVEEQLRIASFLNKECARIDEVIEKTRASIEEYKKLKQSVITQAVTKGIRPDREMKDSGINGVGFIRSDWPLQCLKTISSIIRGGSPRPIEQYISENDTGYNWIRIGDSIKGSKYINSTKRRIIPEGLSKTRFIKKGSLILSNSMSFGQPYILGIDGCIHDGWVAFSGVSVNKEYLYYFLLSEMAMVQFQQQVAGGVVLNLNVDKIGTTKIAIPDEAEQVEIVEYLDKTIGVIESMIERKESLLVDLDSYKKSLIFEYVTGKKEVPA